MPDFIAHTLAGGLGALMLVAIFSLLGGPKSAGTAVILVFFGALFIAHDGYMAFGLVVALLIIWAVWAAKILLHDK